MVPPITADDQERTLRALGDGEENAGDEGFGVVGLLENGDLFAKTGTVKRLSALYSVQ